MLRKIVVVGVAILLSANAFAQQQANPYVEKMQQKFNQANEAAAAKFNQLYPTPHVAPPVNGKLPPVMQPQVAPPPVVSPPKPVALPPQPQVTEGPAKKMPDVAVDADKAQTTVGNIYAPGGNAQDSKDAVNPYR